MIKKFFIISFTLLTVLTLAACGSDDFTVTFDTQGGTAVEAIVTEEDLAVDAPTTPTKADTSDGKVYSFVGWYTDAAGTTVYDFETAVVGNITIYAVWSLDVVLHFDTRTDATIDVQLLGEDGGNAVAPTEPTREGFRFEGWYTTKVGYTWLTEVVEFPYAITEETTLYAYWEPVNSGTMTWGPESTYTQTIDDSSSLILNPMVYEWSHEDAYVDYMVTDLYPTEVDWDKAIADGIADAPADFSKIVAGEFSIDSLDFIRVKLGAVNFPIDADGEEHLTPEGLYDREGAGAILSSEWTINISDQMYFEDGTNITADDYAYTMMMFLDPLLNNSRADMFYKKEGSRDGTPIVNGYEYFSGDVDFDEVGFTVNNDYSFTMTFWEPVSQASAIGYSQNLRLINEEAFELSLTADRENSAYGTPLYPYVSYGEYILKTWDENQKLVFNKNFDYLGKGFINYKSIVVEVVDDVDQRMALFLAGEISVAGLSLDYYNSYAESDQVYRSWRGYPQYILLNLAPSAVAEEDGGNVHPDIMFDERFRQALLYGFDRSYYANSVYQPNTPSLLPIPLDTKIYLQDILYYSESPQHLALLDDLQIDPATEGYIPERAIALFEAAYADWLLDGNTGPVVLNFVSDNDEFTKGLVDHIEATYEALFTVEKLDINVIYLESAASRVEGENWNYDLLLTSVGFGSSTGAHWQYPSINFFGGMLAPYLGLNAPFDESTESGLADWWTSEITVEFPNTYTYLTELGRDSMVADGLDLYIQLLDWLEPTVAGVDGALVDKAAGVFVGSVEDLSWYMWEDGCPWEAVAAEPYPGAASDLWNAIAAFEEIYLNNVISVPTVTRSDAVIYADNVIITWPLYSVGEQWGTFRYRYLDTDPDFME